MRTLPCLCLAAFAPLALAAPQTSERLLSVSRDDAVLREIDPFTGLTRSRIAMTAPGRFVLSALGLAVHPLTGEAWVIVQSPAQSRVLGKVSPATGVVTVVGSLGNQFAALAFDAAGTLYGVTGDGAVNNPETLFTLDLATGQPTLFMALGNGTGGEAIATDPSGLALLHASGVQRGPGPNEILETVALGTRTVSPIPVTGDDYEEALALTHWVGRNFLLTDINSVLFLVSATGQVTQLGNLDHTAKGLAFLPAPPGSAFFQPYGVGCPAPSGHIPVLAGVGTPAFNAGVTIGIAHGPGGAPGVFLFGTGTSQIPIGAGCTLDNGPLLGVVLPFVLAGTGSGRGRLALPVAVPGAPAFDLYLQAAMLDGLTPLLSNALRMRVQ